MSAGELHKAPPNPRGIPESAIPRHLAKEGCNKCFGRGWAARRQNGLVLPCRCVLEATKRLIERGAADAARKSPATG